jgi:hypothetical protein
MIDIWDLANKYMVHNKVLVLVSIQDVSALSQLTSLGLSQPSCTAYSHESAGSLNISDGS